MSRNTRNGGAPTVERATETESATPSAPETESAPVSAPDATPSDAPESAPSDATPSDATPSDATPSDATPTDAPVSAPAIDFSAELESDETERKRVRIFRDVSPRATRDDGKLTCVQRELFADGSLGAYQLALVTITRDKTESVQRAELESLQLNIDALAKLGVHIVRDRRA